MRTTSRFIPCAIALLLAVLPVYSKSKTLDDFIRKANSSLVTFKYSFSTVSDGPSMTGEGDVKLSGSSFLVNGNGLEVWCDGKTRWTIDRSAREAMVESVDEAEDGISANPALLITSVDNAFNEVSFGASKFSGKTADASVLVPLSKGGSSMDIARVTLFFKTGTSDLIGAEVTLNDGTLTRFSISGLKFSDKSKAPSFAFDGKSLGKDYVVTDLR
ncbi:MAG: outer membrane lipoprotein carrier protein LolA [Bacteroidales bacterium]|jgi:hypothetical protein|nr:outer membrane lipoprotein carrier protein LolA [Bacteroidales bacterium]